MNVQAIDLGGVHYVVHPDFVKVESASWPGGFHTVRDRTCTCIGFRFRGTCRHLEEAEAAMRRAAILRKERFTPAKCSRCLELYAFAGSEFCIRCLTEDYHKERA